MRFTEIIRCLECQVFNRGDNFETGEIEYVTAGDLMSEVLVFDKENLLLVTSLNSEQVLRTANIVDAIGVVLVNSKIPNEQMISLARDLGVVLLSTQNSMFETCAILYSLLTNSGANA
ncbi:MAG: DRTGG domain-containing protein [Spirochaetaceae bacterium]|nr:DRTGG domain-containing protein [Spirochaetaceae bacterium]